MSRFRLWSFTSFKEEAPKFGNMRWLAYQQEKAPTTGKLHWQGAVAFENAVTMKGCIERLGGNVSVQEARNWKALKEYVKKTETSVKDTYKEFGKDEEQGKRNDLDEFRDYILENGADDFDIFMKYPSIMARYPKFIEKAKALVNKQKEEFVARGIVFIYGPSGTGKTSLVYKCFGSDGVYNYDYSDKWFDGLERQEIILFDDITGAHQIKRDFLLKIGDGYPMQVPVKGGHTCIPEESTIVITSNNKEDILLLLEDPAIARRCIAHIELCEEVAIFNSKKFNEKEFNEETFEKSEVRKRFKEMLEDKNDGVPNSSLSETSDLWSTEEELSVSQISQASYSSYGSKGLRGGKIRSKVNRK